MCNNENVTHLVEVFPENHPDAAPLQPDAVHVVIRNLDELLQAKHTRPCGRAGRLDLFPRDFAESLDKVDDGRLHGQLLARRLGI